MKKKIVTLLIFAFIAAYAGFWLYHATQAKRFIENELVKLKQPDAQGNRLQFEKVQIGGYPFNYEVLIKNPRFGNGAHVEAFIDGFVTIGTNLWGTKYWIEKSGDIHILDNSAEHKPHQHIVITGQSNLTFDIKNPYSLKAAFHPFEEFTDQSFSEKYRRLFDEINQISFEGKNLAISEGERDRHLMGEVAHLSSQAYRKKTSDNLDQFFLNLEIQGMDAKHKILNYFKYLSAQHYAIETNDMFNSVLSIEPYKFDMQFTGSVAVPQDFKNGFPSQLVVNVQKFNVISDFGTNDLVGNFHYHEKDDLVTIHGDLDAIGKMNENNDQEFVHYFISTLKNIAASDTEDGGRYEKLEKLLRCCQTDLEKIPPHYHEFGPIRTKVNGDIQYNAKGIEADIAIKHLDITTDLYGLQSRGFIKGEVAEVKGEYVIELLDYKSMIEDFAAYYNRIHFLFPILAENPENSPPLISNPMVNKFITFLRKISDHPQEESKNLTITVNFLEPQSVKIGQLSLPEAMVEWGKYRKEIEQDLH